jgi:phosphinothricin acetyltransferase
MPGYRAVLAPDPEEKENLTNPRHTGDSVEYQLAPITIEDREVMIDLFHDFVDTGPSAGFKQKEPGEFFDVILEREESYPNVIVKNRSGYTMGFALLHPHSSAPAISKAAKVSFFVRPRYSGQGLESRMFEYLFAKAEKTDFASIVAGVSSQDEADIRFLEKHGFVECDRTCTGSGKEEQTIDVVWMQKML